MEKGKKLECLDGQEKIYEALENKDHKKLWNEVKLIGYKEISSPSLRRLIMLKSFKKFDAENNNNFVHFYYNQIKHTAMNYNKKYNKLTKDKRAIADYMERKMWPTNQNEVPVNQNANILRNFKFREDF